jgi:hypothetical protein
VVLREISQYILEVAEIEIMAVVALFGLVVISVVVTVIAEFVAIVAYCGRRAFVVREVVIRAVVVGVPRVAAFVRLIPAVQVMTWRVVR